MHTVVKWIVTIVVVLFAVYVYTLSKNIVPYWIAPLFACALFGLWLMKDPNKKKEKRFPLRNGKEKPKE